MTPEFVLCAIKMVLIDMMVLISVYATGDYKILEAEGQR